MIEIGYMTTIDDLDIKIYIQYAQRTQAVEQINRQLRLEEAASIPPQIQMVDLFPKLSEMEILLGVLPVSTPWALFFPPPRYRFQRRSPFGFFRVAPSLGSFEEEERDRKKMDEIECDTEEEKEEKQTLKKCFQQIEKINHWIGFIVGQVGRFLQG